MAFLAVDPEQGRMIRLGSLRFRMVEDDDNGECIECIWCKENPISGLSCGSSLETDRNPDGPIETSAAAANEQLSVPEIPKESETLHMPKVLEPTNETETPVVPELPRKKLIPRYSNFNRMKQFIKNARKKGNTRTDMGSNVSPSQATPPPESQSLAPETDHETELPVLVPYFDEERPLVAYFDEDSQ